MGVISYLSSFDTKSPGSIPLIGLSGPRNILPFGVDILAIAVFSVVIYLLAIRVRWPRSARARTSATSRRRPGKRRKP